MTRKALLIMIASAVMAGGLNGCEWKDATYDAYVKDGRVVTCPPEFDEHNVFFPTLTCAENDSDNKYPKGGFKGQECLDDTNRCKSDSGCELCNEYRLDYLACMNFRSNGFFEFIKDGSPAKQLSFMGSDQNNNSIGAYSEAAQHQICPKDYPICGFRKNNDGKGEFGCIEDNIIASCKDGYHLNNTGCVADSVEACGASEINCTETEGWTKAECRAGACVATECGENFHLDNDSCEVDSIMNCGSHGHKCDVNFGVKQVACIEGACVDYLCDTNYHKSETDKACEMDKYQACGSWNNSCGTRVGWRFNESDDGESNGACIAGHCIAYKCDDGYHLIRDLCEQDSNSNCGGTNCALDDKICSNGKCVSTCPVGEEQCTDGCFDTNKDVSHCGNCEKKCDTHDTVITTCDEGKCNYQCPAGRGDCNNDMSDGCETDLSMLKLKYNEKGICTCLPGYGDCNGSMSDGCETEVNKYGLEYIEGECRCKASYATCGKITTDKTSFPRCLQDKLDNYGLKDNGKTCGCEEPYTQCGTIRLEIGVNDTLTELPLCLKQGNYYSNHSLSDNSQSGNNSSRFRNDKWVNNQHVYYDYKANNGCQLSVSFWEQDGRWGYYKYLGNEKTGWQGKDRWSSDTCEILCNTKRTEISSSNPRGGISNANVSMTVTHQCYPKGVCNQFDAFDAYNDRYYDYGCKDGVDGYYHEKRCDE